jgi:hypothetical protein
MFHVKPAAPALLLGVVLCSAAVIAQGDAERPPANAAETSSSVDAGVSGAAAGQDAGAAPSKQPGKKKTRKSSAASSSSATKKASSSTGTSQRKSVGATSKKTSSSKTTKRDPRVVGLGRSCTKRAHCSAKSQICLKQQDNRGKTLPRGFCALPCASIEQGLTPVRPGFPARDPQTTEKILKKAPPSRCPPRFKCRSKGGDLSIDLCVRE